MRLMVNEMVPRPHNSGHYGRCGSTQFDLQMRALAGLPWLQPHLHSAAAWLN